MLEAVGPACWSAVGVNLCRRTAQSDGLDAFREYQSATSGIPPLPLPRRTVSPTAIGLGSLTVEAEAQKKRGRIAPPPHQVLRIGKGLHA